MKQFYNLNTYNSAEMQNMSLSYVQVGNSLWINPVLKYMSLRIKFPGQTVILAGLSKLASFDRHIIAINEDGFNN